MISADCSKVAMCEMFCQNGFETDIYGCPICKCKESNVTCSKAMCRMYCQFGFQKDNNNCSVCKCVPPPASLCPAITCQMECQHGFVKDKNGCDTCQCLPYPEHCKVCKKYCQHGFKIGEDGCPLCQCNHPTTTVSPNKEDPCDPNPCEHGTCQQKEDGFSCMCDQYYHGETCNKRHRKEL